MPARTGSLTYARFFVREALPKSFLAKAHDAILLHAMRPLHADEPDAERSGWCVMGDAGDIELPSEKVFLDGFLNLGLRTDRWAIPGPLLRSKVREAEALYRERSGRERLGKREKAELKEVVTRELRKKLVPATRAVDLSWSLEEGLVRFFSHTEKATTTMLELFAKTFQVELVPEAPFTLADRLDLGEDELAAWEQLEPTTLFEEAAHASR